MQYRHELKFIINYAEYAVIRMRMRAVMKRDQHVNANGMYTIRSLYFDDYHNSAYNEKYMGILDRQKYRIRIYNNSDSVISLERKIKWNSYVNKQVSRLTREQADEIIKGKYDCLVECNDPLQQVFYHECRSNVMRPRAVVDYEREPYIMDAGNVRVTFDQHVRVGVEGWDIFNEKMSMIEMLDPNYLVMEVKFSEFLPSIIQSMLPQKATDFVAVSKYVLGCDMTLYRRAFDS